MMGGAELIDRLDNESSRPAGTAGPVAEGLTAESWTWRNLGVKVEVVKQRMLRSNRRGHVH